MEWTEIMMWLISTFHGLLLLSEGIFDFLNSGVEIEGTTWTVAQLLLGPGFFAYALYAITSFIIDILP